MAIIPWISAYPAALDSILTNFPRVTNNVDEVLASHVNSLADAVVALEAKVGPDKPFPFRPTTANLGTPAITGTITGGVATADIDGSTIATPYDLIQITATDPQAGSYVVVPVNLPAGANPLPDRFSLDVIAFATTPPSFDYEVQFAFSDASENLSWIIDHRIEAVGSTRPALTILEFDTGVLGASWDLPDLPMSTAVLATVNVEKVAPFSNPPQLRMEFTCSNLQSTEPSVTSSIPMTNPSSGSVSAGWAGENFEGFNLVVFYPNTMVGAVTTYVAVNFEPHIKDR